MQRVADWDRKDFDAKCWQPYVNAFPGAAALVGRNPRVSSLRSSKASANPEYSALASAHSQLAPAKWVDICSLIQSLHSSCASSRGTCVSMHTTGKHANPPDFPSIALGFCNTQPRAPAGAAAADSAPVVIDLVDESDGGDSDSEMRHTTAQQSPGSHWVLLAVIYTPGGQVVGIELDPAAPGRETVHATSMQVRQPNKIFKRQRLLGNSLIVGA